MTSVATRASRTARARRAESRDGSLRAPEQVQAQFVTIREESLVKSRERVKSYGEVFTPRHMVDRMLDLVAFDLEEAPDFVDKTFLEPAAGDGNFLVAILERKLRAIEKRIEAPLWPQESLFALASIYGIELLEDNHADAQAIMLDEFTRFHLSHDQACGQGSRLYLAAQHLIATNVVRGNALTSQTADGEPIEFSWWHRTEVAGYVQREPFSLASLTEGAMFDFADYAQYAPCAIDRVHLETGQ